MIMRQTKPFCRRNVKGGKLITILVRITIIVTIIVKKKWFRQGKKVQEIGTSDKFMRVPSELKIFHGRNISRRREADVHRRMEQSQQVSDNEFIHFFSGFYFLLKFVNRNEKSKQFHYFVRIVSVKMGMHFYLKKKT